MVSRRVGVLKDPPTTARNAIRAVLIRCDVVDRLIPAPLSSSLVPNCPRDTGLWSEPAGRSKPGRRGPGAPGPSYNPDTSEALRKRSRSNRWSRCHAPQTLLFPHARIHGSNRTGIASRPLSDRSNSVTPRRWAAAATTRLLDLDQTGSARSLLSARRRSVGVERVIPVSAPERVIRFGSIRIRALGMPGRVAFLQRLAERVWRGDALAGVSRGWRCVGGGSCRGVAVEVEGDREEHGGEAGGPGE